MMRAALALRKRKRDHDDAGHAPGAPSPPAKLQFVRFAMLADS